MTRFDTKMVFLLSVLVMINFYTNAQNRPKDRSAHYPTFSWETVPVAFHFGKRSALMTPEEARFVASKSNFICLEKGHAYKQLE